MRRNLHTCREEGLISIILKVPINQKQNMNNLSIDNLPKKYKEPINM